MKRGIIYAFRRSLKARSEAGGVPRERGFTLVEFLVVLVIIIIIIALIIPAFARSARQSKVEACASHLKTLHQSHRSRTAPFEPGKAYWLRLPGVDPRVLSCPVLGRPRPGTSQYWGPAVEPAKLAEADPLACDEPVNHSPTGKEGGNVLRKSGDVAPYNGLTGVWDTCLQGGKVRP